MTWDVLRYLLGTIPIVLALVAVRAANLKKPVRARQFPMPAIAVVYAFIAFLVLYQFNQVFTALVDLVLTAVPSLRPYYDTSWLYFLENTLILLVFALAKWVLGPILRKAFDRAEFPLSGFVARFYAYDEDYATWFLQRRRGQLRQMLRAFYIAAIVITVALTVLIHAFPSWPGFLSVSFPAIVALVIGEFYFFVDGLTKREFQRDVLGENDAAQRVANYGALREVFRAVFGDRILSDGVNLTSSDAIKTFSLLDDLSHSSSDVDRIAAAYYQRRKQDGHRVDSNLVEAAVGFLHGTSALINNPFYTDLTDYVCFPAYYNLLQRKKVLVVSGRDAIARDLVDWMVEGLESITGVPALWGVALLDEVGSDELDVGILRFADIHNLEVITSNDDFFADVGLVILAEPSRMLATGQLGLGLVLGRCGRSRTPVFAAFDSNHDGLVDALSHLFKTSLTNVIASALPSGASSEVVWRADGRHMHSSVLPTITRYLGMGTEIAALALKHQVSQVYWVGADRFPVSDMTWIAGQYYSQINAFADLDLSQSALGESLTPLANPWNIGQAENRFLVVEDELSNLFESIRLYGTRACNEGFVNLIADDYLLRDYMVANRAIFAADPKAIPSIVPDFARTERNSVLRLILDLVAFDVSDAALAKELEIIGVTLPESENDPPSSLEPEAPELVALRGLLEKHTGIADLAVTATLIPPGLDTDPEAPPSISYRVARGPALGELLDSLRSAYFFVEDEIEERNYIGGLLFGHVYQALLPGQFVTYGGKYYEVQGIGTAAYRNGVVLRRAAEHIRDRRVYRQLRRFVISDLVPSDAVGGRVRIEEIELRRSFASIEVSTLGYLELPSRSDLVDARRVEIDGVPIRRYAQKELLEIRLPGVEPGVRRTIALLLNELFVTVFPHSHEYVEVLTSDPDREMRDLLSELSIDGAADSIFVVEDSIIDLGLIVAVQRNWRRLFETITDYLDWQLSVAEIQDGDGTASASSQVVVFPDDRPEEVAERRDRIARGEVEAARRPWGRRLIDWVRSWFPRRSRPQFVLEPPEEQDMVLAPETETETETEVEPEREAGSEAEAVPEPDMGAETDVESDGGRSSD